MVVDKKEYQKKYHQKHKEKAKKYYQKYYLENKEDYNKNKEYFRRYYEKTKDIQLSNNKRWHDEHPEASKIRFHKRRSLLAKADGKGLTKGEWENIRSEYSNICPYCNKKKKLTIEHIVPLYKGGAHDVGNISPSCGTCNSKKGTKSLLVFMLALRNENVEV